MPIFRVKSVKIYTGQKNLHWRRQRQLSGMVSDEVDNDYVILVLKITMFYYLMNKKTMVSDWMSRKYNQNQHLQRTMDKGEIRR